MPHHLLLADDSVTIQRVIKLTFADEDVDVVTVGDGDQAVAAIDKAPPDIVLADVAMPGRTGYDVAQHIRQTPRLSHIPVVLLTGAFEPVDEARASKVGCDAVLAKPFEPEVVVTRVRELLARSRLNAAPASAERSVPPVVTPPAMPVAPASAAAAAIPIELPPAPPVPVAAVPGSLAGMPAPAIDPSPSTLAWTSAPPATGPAAGFVPPATPTPAATEEPLATSASALPGSSASSGTRPTPAPVPAKRSPAEVDAYFDRLDEAFASLATAPRPAPVPVPESRAVPSLSLVPPAAPRPPAPSVDPAPAASLAAAFEGLLAPGPTGSGPIDQPSTAPAVEHLAAPPPQPAGATAAVTTATAPAATTTDEPRGGGLTDAQVTELADRVLAHLTARLGEQTLPEIVAQVAERLVRAEIDQIKRRV